MDNQQLIEFLVKIRSSVAEFVPKSGEGVINVIDNALVVLLTKLTQG